MASLLLFLACGLPLAVSAPGCAPPAEPRTGFQCATSFVDFGSAWEGEILEHRFVFEAFGPETRSIEAIKADCGCTVAELGLTLPDGGARGETPYVHGTPIPPGSRLVVTVRYDTRGKRGVAARTITLYSDAGNSAVTVSADVRPRLVVEPARRDLPLLDQGDRTETSFEVSSANGELFALEHVRRAIPPALLVTLEPTAGALREPSRAGAPVRASAWDVHVQLGPGMPTGSHVYPIQLDSDIYLPVRASATGAGSPMTTAGEGGRFASGTPWVTLRVVGAVSLDPPSMPFGVIGREEVVARSLRLWCHDADFELPEPVVTLVPIRAGGASKSASDASDGRIDGSEDGAEGDAFPFARTARITTRAVPGENAWDVQLLLTGLDDAVEGTLLAKLVIETGHPEAPRLEAPVSGVCIEPPRGRR